VRKPRRKCQRLADAMPALNVYVCNNGQPTFVRGVSMTHIDVTFVSESLADKVHGWKILDEESNSLHKYICFEIIINPRLGTGIETMKWSVLT